MCNTVQAELLQFFSSVMTEDWEWLRLTEEEGRHLDGRHCEQVVQENVGKKTARKERRRPQPLQDDAGRQE